MKNKMRMPFQLTTLLLFLVMVITACSPAGKTDSPGEQAGAVSSGGESAALQDGTYVPETFTAQGGTGKVKITCPEVTLTQGEAQAVIEFSSPHYEWVKVNGQQYDPENAQEQDRKNSVFRIPVVLDEEMKISGLTTAMSEPHEIEYTLFISLTQKDGSEGTEGSEGAGSAGSGRETADREADNNSQNDTETGAEDGEDTPAAGGRSSQQQSPSEPPVIEGLTFVSAMEKEYAETFDIYSYKLADGSKDALYRLIDVHNSGQYLILPENSSPDKTGAQQKMLKKLPSSVTVLKASPGNIYVAATSSMALFDAAGAIGQVKMTGTKAEGWYIDAPKKALADGSMIYAGKYSAPDYELLASSGCDLAVESMMILHTPEVKEKLEELGIPVFIDTSSNESHPMGRTEWVRLYGVLTGHEKEAEAFFEEQNKQFAQSAEYTDTGLTVAFFSISSGGNVIVRATDDYIPRMIELAGGNYIFKDLLNESGNSASVRLSMEDFYNTAKDADFLIYNATIENPVKNIDQLCGRSALLADFKAVQEGNVWQVQRSLYQSPDIAAMMITDLRRMLTGKDTENMTFLEQLQ